MVLCEVCDIERLRFGLAGDAIDAMANGVSNYWLCLIQLPTDQSEKVGEIRAILRAKGLDCGNE